MRVQVYFNLHKSVFSVVALEGPNKGRVIAHMETVVLNNPTFHVSESGRQRVIREKRKNVHAFVRGELSDLESWGFVMGPRQFSYNPYRAGHFYDRESGSALTRADCALMLAQRGRPATYYRGVAQ